MTMDNRCRDIDEEQILMLKKYPYLVSCDNFTKWEGVIYSKGVRHHLIIKTPNYPSLYGYSVFCSQELLFSNSTDKQIAENDSLLDLLSKIELNLSSSCGIEKTSEDNRSFEYLSTLLKIVTDIEQSIGRNNVISVDPRMNWIQLKYSDSGNYDNSIKISLDINYPQTTLRILNCDLPDEVIAHCGQVKRLNDLYNWFVETVESLIPFWGMTSNLSDEAWIIEPLDPLRKDIHRRIFLSDDLSVQLTFDPLNIDSMPDIKFLGSLNAVSQARATYQKSLQESGWWSDSSIVDNLCRLLKFDSLPKKSNQDNGVKITSGNSDEEANECAICYEISTESEILPAKWCSNNNCSGRFHHSCLLKWLNSVATSKISFDHSSGPCPHCDEKIFCPLKLK